MTLQRTLMLRQQVDLNIGHRRTTAHEVMTHQTVKIVGRSSSRIDLIIDGCWVFTHNFGHLQRGGGFRVGLEDWPNGTSNVEQIKRAKEIINAVGRPLVTGAEAIKYLDIKLKS